MIEKAANIMYKVQTCLFEHNLTATLFPSKRAILGNCFFSVFNEEIWKMVRYLGERKARFRLVLYIVTSDSLIHNIRYN